MRILESFARMGCDHTKTAYLADGVYVSSDGYQIWLATEREGLVSLIALEPAALKELNQYFHSMNGGRGE